ncbi:MAG: cation diffusion facilitator family transporter [Verrucomicrobiota bacterium]|nr:cation diffusion facilitator family transporter [Verrucomicrobiota bacterium]
MSSGHSHEHGSAEGLRAAFFLNLAFTFIEIAGGFWTNSVAILTDALHDGGDCASLGLAWYLQKLSRKQPDAGFTYGYGRFSTLGAVITSVVLIAGLSVMLWHALERLMHPQEVYAPGMILLALLGLLANGAAVLKTRHGTSLNERMVSWHLLEDVLGWGAVLLGSIAMSLWHLPVLDPLLSILIALFVLWNVGRNLRKVGAVFLQHAPASFDVAEFQRRLTTLPKVVSSHHAHTWTIDGEHHVLSLHVVVQNDATRDQIVEVKRQIKSECGEEFEHVTIDVELAGESCLDCHQ